MPLRVLLLLCLRWIDQAEEETGQCQKPISRVKILCFGSKGGWKMRGIGKEGGTEEGRRAGALRYGMVVWGRLGPRLLFWCSPSLLLLKGTFGESHILRLSGVRLLPLWGSPLVSREPNTVRMQPQEIANTHNLIVIIIFFLFASQLNIVKNVKMLLLLISVSPRSRAWVKTLSASSLLDLFIWLVSLGSRSEVESELRTGENPGKDVLLRELPLWATEFQFCWESSEEPCSKRNQTCSSK